MQLIIASPDGEILKTDRVDWVNIIRSDGYPISIYANTMRLWSPSRRLVILNIALKARFTRSGFLPEILSVADNVIRCWIDDNDKPEADETPTTQT